ncbi:hypothetical protein SK128_022928 [Halocaridina rubra]|uniref:Trehalase n=1 Tax=Halocaridina rubra TaxID=373956 RepID=A0AAN8WAU8_HALRR
MSDLTNCATTFLRYPYGTSLKKENMSDLTNDATTFLRYPNGTSLKKEEEKKSDLSARHKPCGHIHPTNHVHGTYVIFLSSPEFLVDVIDPALQEWGHQLNDLWKFLGRKISGNVAQEPEKYSQIYVSHPVVVPGGRFRESIDLLEKEFQFWEKQRSVNVTDSKGKTHTVAQYRVEVSEPRPESFSEDYKLAENLTTEDAKQQLYVELKSGAESGWDYSTRWIVNNDTNEGTLKDLKVTSIAPVDLNSLLCMNARILSEFYKKAGNYSKEKYYEDLANSKNNTMAELFWDNTDGTWHDYDITKQKKRRYFYLSNIHPLWSDCYGKEGSRAHTVENVIKYLKSMKVLDHIGGVPTSLEKSGQQWDYPNAWAPLQHIAILGLYNARSIHHEAESLSFSLAEKWIRTTWLGYQQSTPHAMFEKYNVEIMGLPGGGGEYDVQLGFGWTNGVAMHLLDIYGDRLTAARGGSTSFKAPSWFSFVSLMLIPFLYQTLSW